MDVSHFFLAVTAAVWTVGGIAVGYVLIRILAFLVGTVGKHLVVSMFKALARNSKVQWIIVAGILLTIIYLGAILVGIVPTENM